MVAEFIPKTTFELSDQGEVAWQSPSNIAIVKYWGKKGVQLPINPSISFTLEQCHTQTTVCYRKKKTKGISFDFDFEKSQNLKFKIRVQTFLERVITYFPFLEHYHLSIKTKNSFPHSSGVASSASGMAALALCLTAVEERYNPFLSGEGFYRKSSYIARLGSGSACRSVKGKIVSWGEHPSIKGSSDFYGLPLEDTHIHSVFQDYCDTILIVDKGQKEVSSSTGHRLVNDHPFAEKRVEVATDNIGKIVKILKEGDIESFISVVEQEALMLHAMMMTSSPYYILMKPNTLQIIHKIWQLRKERVFKKLCFTLDAGANMHLLYPKSEENVYKKIIEEELKPFCKDGNIIYDRLGLGSISLA